MSTLFDTKYMKSNKFRPESHEYLQILTSLAKKPETVSVVGRLPETRRPTVAIVGTRKPSAYGKEVTQQIGSELASKGVVIVSGLALGVDALAHRSALEVGGTTIAVLPSGLGRLYPRTNTQLARQIVEQGGAVLTEYETDYEARPYSFLERNRIVSGLSDAVLITEAAARSGTLNTAAHALEQGKDVFVVPGNITSALSIGCNMLLKQGAHVATCASDILEVIAPQLLSASTAKQRGSAPEETLLIDLLATGVRDGDELQQKSQLSADTFGMTLTMLEITGVVQSLGANQWTLR